MPPALATTRPSPPRRDKPNFVKRALGFAKRVPPGGSLIWIGTLGAIVVMTTVGAFGTGALPLPTRIAFWTLLLGWNAAKWHLWILATVRERRRWPTAVTWGALCLNLLVPIEVRGALWAIGRPGPVSHLSIWLSALAISAALALPIFAALGRWPTPPFRRRGRAVAPAGPLARAGVDPAEVVAMEAEDHYCRLHRAGGGQLLIHGRFRDGLAELDGVAGARIHRGAWVAESGVAGAVREGRQWRLVLSDGRRLNISARHLAEARSRGWLRPPG
jgi:hypothetical protein